MIPRRRCRLLRRSFRFQAGVPGAFRSAVFRWAFGEAAKPAEMLRFGPLRPAVNSDPEHDSQIESWSSAPPRSARVAPRALPVAEPDHFPGHPDWEACAPPPVSRTSIRAAKQGIWTAQKTSDES